LDSGKVARDELFITTKLPAFAINTKRVETFLERSLKNLRLNYVDLYLIHTPFGLEFGEDKNPLVFKDGLIAFDTSPESKLEDVWKVMEKQVDLGKVRSIGISNFDESQVERIVKVARIPPANLQVELHAYLQQKSLRSTCEKYGIKITAYSSLGSLGRKNWYESIGINFKPLTILEDPVVAKIAGRNGKSSAQILLRFLVQQGIAVIPKSSSASRLQENFKILDFELSRGDMALLEGLDKGDAGRTLKFEFLPGIINHPEFPENLKRSLKY